MEEKGETADSDASQLLITLLESSFIQIQLLHRPSDNADPLLPDSERERAEWRLGNDTLPYINFSKSAAVHSAESFGASQTLPVHCCSG